MGEIPSGEGGFFIKAGCFIQKHKFLRDTVGGVVVAAAINTGISEFVGKAEAAESVKSPILTSDRLVSGGEKKSQLTLAEQKIMPYLAGVEFGLEPTDDSERFAFDGPNGSTIVFTDGLRESAKSKLSNTTKTVMMGDQFYKSYCKENNNLVSNVSKYLKPGQVVVVSERDVEGVYVFDPVKYKDGKIISRVTSAGPDMFDIKGNNCARPEDVTIRIKIDKELGPVLADDNEAFCRFDPTIDDVYNEKWVSLEEEGFKMYGNETEVFLNKVDELSGGNIWGIIENDCRTIKDAYAGEKCDVDEINRRLVSAQIIPDSKGNPAFLVVVSQNENDPFHGLHAAAVENCKQTFVRINTIDPEKVDDMVKGGLFMITGDSPENGGIFAKGGWEYGNASYKRKDGIGGVIFWNEMTNKGIGLGGGFPTEVSVTAMTWILLSEEGGLRHMIYDETKVSLSYQKSDNPPVDKTTRTVVWANQNENKLTEYECFHLINRTIGESYQTLVPVSESIGLRALTKAEKNGKRGINTYNSMLLKLQEMGLFKDREQKRVE